MKSQTSSDHQVAHADPWNASPFCACRSTKPPLHRHMWLIRCLLKSIWYGHILYIFTAWLSKGFKLECDFCTLLQQLQCQCNTLSYFTLNTGGQGSNTYCHFLKNNKLPSLKTWRVNELFSKKWHDRQISFACTLLALSHIAAGLWQIPNIILLCAYNDKSGDNVT